METNKKILTYIIQTTFPFLELNMQKIFQNYNDQSANTMTEILKTFFSVINVKKQFLIRKIPKTLLFLIYFHKVIIAHLF